jgi:GalNAc-alpha-(1->4)-GalNAc-alpha-(1->3)-diNAcBac-PP-undecaprenol alpha-1,4-N-acetyl-D-galactosaminyltransferase
MKLLFVIDSFGSGGAQRQMVQLAVGLAEAGHELEFFIYVPSHDHFRRVVEDADILVHEYVKSSRYSLGIVPRLARVMRDGAFDLVLAYLTTPGVYAELAARLNRLHGVRTPVVVSERGPLQHVRSTSRLLLGAHHLADRVVTNSRNNRDQLISLWPALHGRTSVIYNGIDLSLFKPGDEPLARRDALDILAIGTLLPSKDAIVLVEALALHRGHFGWTPTVSWVGKLAPSGGDALYERRVRSRIAALELEASWTWVGERHDIPALLQSHDVLVHASVLEGLPNAVCEALACGLPVIAAEIGDNQALIASGETGFLYMPGDAAALTESQADRTRMRIAARAFAARTLDLRRCVANYEALFRRTIQYSR